MRSPISFILVALMLLCVAALATMPHHTQAKKHPPHEYVYVNCGTVQQFRVGEDGGLVALNPAAAPGGSSGPYIYIGPNKQYAYAPNINDSTVSQYRIRSDGTLGPLTPPNVPTGIGNQFMTFAPDGHAAYVSNLGSNTVSQYRVSSDGALAPMRPPQVPSGDIVNALCLPSHRHFAYAPGEKGIAQFAVLPGGSLRPLSPQIVSVPGDAERMVCDPSGRFLYTSGIGQGGIRQYHIRADGQLVPLSPAVISLPYPAYFAKGAVPSGYLYALVVATGIAQFRIGADGQLVPIRPTPKSDPDFVTFATGGHFAYDLEDDGTLHTYKVDADGGLTPVNSPLMVSRVAGDPMVVPSGRFVYVPGFDMRTIWQFRVQADGSLAPLRTPAVDVNGRPSTLTTLKLP